MINIQENERRRLSQELHDEVGQNLVALQMEVKILENKYEVLKKEQATVSIREKYAQIYQSIYNMLHWLRPRIIDDIGLFKSLTSKYFQTPLNKVNIQYIPKISPHVDTLPDKLTIAIFRIIQESVTNAIKHSSASEFTVKLNVENNIQLTIFDNGVGFSNSIKSTNSLSGFGLQGIKDRVISLGGSYNFNSSNGVKLEILLPFN